MILLSEQGFPFFQAEENYGSSTTIELNASVIAGHFIQIEYELGLIDLKWPL